MKFFGPLKILGLVILLATPAAQSQEFMRVRPSAPATPTITLAEDPACPPERPISRRVVDYTRPVTCTLMLCAPTLVCSPTGGDCSVVPINTCNACSQPVAFDGCFTAEEIEKATK